MCDYTSSSSSDSDNQSSSRTLNLSNKDLDCDTLHHNLNDLTSTDKRITDDTDTLLLYNNRLNRLPANINLFQQLKVLDISSNRLKYLPECLEQCPLSTLIARNNELENDCFPKSFSSLNLKELNLSGNQFSFFPQEILNLKSLKYLYLGGNKIINIPKDICKLTGLTILYLGGNQVTEVPPSVGLLKNLQALILCDNNIEVLPSSIANLKVLRQLLLHKNKLRALPRQIIKLRSLTELSLRDNPLVVSFASQFATNPPTLLEHAGRVIKAYSIPYSCKEIPRNLVQYLDSAHCCVNPKCGGVFFDNRVEHIKFVDFCGKYKVPLLEYLCSSKCIPADCRVDCDDRLLKKVLLG